MLRPEHMIAGLGVDLEQFKRLNAQSISLLTFQSGYLFIPMALKLYRLPQSCLLAAEAPYVFREEIEAIKFRRFVL